MVLNNFKCNHLMPLHFKGLNHIFQAQSRRDWLTRLCLHCITWMLIMQLGQPQLMFANKVW